MKVYLYKNDEQFGPYTLEQVQALVDDGTHTPIDSAWFDGCDEWTTVSHLPGIEISEQQRHQHLVPPFEAYSGDKPYVFVSYAHADGELVFREVKKLHDAGYRIWYDEGIEPGNDWPEHIANAVINCSLFLIFTSPRSAASENCRNEVNLALNRKKKFLAIHLEETDLPPGLELRMGDLQAILKFRMPDVTYRKKLFTGMKNMLGEGGRDIPEGDDPVAAAMAVEVDADYLMAPKEDDSSGAYAPVSSARPTKTKGNGLWIGIGLAVTLCLAWFFFLKDDNAEPSSEALLPLDRKIWEFETGGMVRSSPTTGPRGTIYVGSDDSKVYALNRVLGEKLWVFQTGGEITSTPAIGGRDSDILYVGSSDRKLYALNAISGKKIWEFATEGRVSSSPAVDTNNIVYFGSGDNKIYALGGKQGRKKWEFETGGPVNSSPALLAGLLYVGSHDRKIYALNADTGKKLWEFETGGEVKSSPAVARNRAIYCGSSDNNVYALNRGTGKELWRFETGGEVRSSPAVGSDGTVYFGSMDKKIYALNGVTGKKLWEFEVDGMVPSSPAVGADGSVYIGAYGKKLFALNGVTGKKLWEFKTGGPVLSPPMIADGGIVYFGTNYRKIYAIQGTANAADSPWPMFRSDPRHTGRVRKRFDP